MNNMRLKQALHYQLDYMVKSYWGFFGVILAIMIFIRLLMAFAGNAVSFELPFAGDINIGVGEVQAQGHVNFNIGIPVIIMLFIVGIIGIREDIKMLLQHGMGRYTIYFSGLINSLLTGAFLGFICMILSLIANRWPGFFVIGSVVSVQGFLNGWILNIGGFFFAWQLGSMISLIYYRLNHIQQVIFSVSAGAVLLFGVPNIISRIGAEAFAESLSNIFVNNAILTLFLLGASAAAFNFLLLRRAEVKE